MGGWLPGTSDGSSFITGTPNVRLILVTLVLGYWIYGYVRGQLKYRVR